MAYHARWKTVGTKAAKRKPIESLGVYEIPDDAIRLVEDITTLEIMQSMLDRLQATSFVAQGAMDYSDRKDEAYKTLRRLAFLINLMKRIAEGNLTNEFLAGVRIKPRPNKQTISDVLQLLTEGFGRAD